MGSLQHQGRDPPCSQELGRGRGIKSPDYKLDHKHLQHTPTTRTRARQPPWCRDPGPVLRIESSDYGNGMGLDLELVTPFEFLISACRFGAWIFPEEFWIPASGAWILFCRLSSHQWFVPSPFAAAHSSSHRLCGQSLRLEPFVRLLHCLYQPLTCV